MGDDSLVWLSNLLYMVLRMKKTGGKWRKKYSGT